MDLKHLWFEKPRVAQEASLPCRLSNLIQSLLFFCNLAAKHQITNMFDYFWLLFPQEWCLFLCIYALQGPGVHRAEQGDKNRKAEVCETCHLKFPAAATWPFHAFLYDRGPGAGS